MGVYQGSCMGLGFWHPVSEMPEQGYCEFPTASAARTSIDFLCSPSCDSLLRRADLTVEPFDHAESARLIEAGRHFRQAQTEIRVFADALLAAASSRN
jgi:hypothetical protein